MEATSGPLKVTLVSGDKDHVLSIVGIELNEDGLPNQLVAKRLLLLRGRLRCVQCAVEQTRAVDGRHWQDPASFHDRLAELLFVRRLERIAIRKGERSSDAWRQRGKCPRGLPRRTQLTASAANPASMVSNDFSDDNLRNEKLDVTVTPTLDQPVELESAALFEWMKRR